jgi:3-hydroxyisobutyrate dehydrogenase-like beta-hydroxyacid dehydrogenase
MRLGLIGLGRMGAFHANTLVGRPAVDSLVATDIVAEKVRQVVDRLGVEGVDSVEELLAAGVDGVIFPLHRGGRARSRLDREACTKSQKEHRPVRIEDVRDHGTR